MKCRSSWQRLLCNALFVLLRLSLTSRPLTGTFLAFISNAGLLLFGLVQCWATGASAVCCYLPEAFSFSRNSAQMLLLCFQLRRWVLVFPIRHLTDLATSTTGLSYSSHVVTQNMPVNPWEAIPRKRRTFTKGQYGAASRMRYMDA